MSITNSQEHHNNVYVVLEEEGWEHLAVGQCSDAGEVVAILDPRSLEPLADGFERQWRPMSEPRSNIWAALVDWRRLRQQSFGEPLVG